MRTYIAEPARGARNWEGKEAEQQAVYANRRRVRGEYGKGMQQYGKGMQRRRDEKIERNFAHQFDTGGMDRLWVRGRENVHKKLLLQASACNLALLLRRFNIFCVNCFLVVWLKVSVFSFFGMT